MSAADMSTPKRSATYRGLVQKKRLMLGAFVVLLLLSLLLQLCAGAVLGLVVLYGVAFAESPIAHNAAHDVRHVTVKPCH